MTRSLRWRLLLGAAGAILAALAVAWVFMTVLFERHLERRLETELTRDGLRLVAALEIAADGAPLIRVQPMDPRLHTPAGGYYWQVSNARGRLYSRSLWDGELPRSDMPPAGEWRLRRHAGPYGEPVVLLERRVAPDADGDGVLIQLAQDTAPLTTARAEFGRELGIFLALLWLVLSAAAWLQVRLGLRPLRKIRGDLAALHASAAARLPDPGLREIRPLTSAINALADARERDLELARRRAADLAHGLKTPLAAMMAQSQRARDAGADKAADGLDRAIAAIRRAVDSELARTRIAAARREPGGHVAVRTVVERLVTVLEHTEAGGRLAFAIDVPASLQLPVHVDDLSEILGAVLENAVRHARRQVRVSGVGGPEWTRLRIDDDGPGIASDKTRAALVRGGRLDEGGTGSGLGLAIARELVEAVGGQIGLSASPLGGLGVEFLWGPARSACPERSHRP
ncbi:HAMP domain-containing histidine kinase [Luteimonas sp. SJ-92]|uniref:histidine kinase n=1 Tax=Luteimonas salinisoli TaxID=2752307 RepID=A0A853JCB1_9GAMM|nr:HAMP domain-containing sensor histidine kinase [Luteimonas salinisoli]NZA26896.1 HAMP domain-containing histidine kinase [Luteimonas salinisoli]